MVHVRTTGHVPSYIKLTPTVRSLIWLALIEATHDKIIASIL